MVYLALVAASHAVEALIAPEPGSPPAAEVPITTDEGALSGTMQEIVHESWGPPGGAPGGRAAVLLLHGSPGDGSNFSELGPLLGGAGYEVIAPDLPGFGDSTRGLPSYSVLAHAHAMALMLDAMGIERAHVVGWSQGGGVGLHMADLYPDRVASLTLMASVGVQEAEGSGSYAFEHLKYGVGYAGLVLGGEAIPHFGVLGSFGARKAFIRNFWDSDQRPLRALMERLETPTLILHGRQDFLTPLWAAEVSHGLIGPSRLVVLEASHFLPFLQAEEAAGHLTEFFAGREAGAPVVREVVDLSVRAEGVFARAARGMEWVQREAPWWLVLAAIGAVAFARPEGAAALAGVLAAMVWVDAGVACAGLFAGVLGRTVWAQRSRRVAGRVSRGALTSWEIELRRGWFGAMLRTRVQPWRRDEAAAAAGVVGREAGALGALLGHAGALVGIAVWTGAAFVAALIVATLLRIALGDSVVMLACALAACLLAVRIAVLLTTWTGRQRLKASITRGLKHEFWPAWAFYAPLVPWLAWHGVRSGGVMSFTCVNPVIGAGGGVVGESKSAILRGLAGLGPALLSWARIEPGEPRARLETLRGAMGRGEFAGEYPVVLKPDSGQRGYAVRIARSEADALDYLSRMPRPVVAQEFHPGPVEVGCMWIRDPEARDGRSGRLFSINTKHFSDLVGDGRRTIEQLIYRHRRFRCQADTFLARFADRRLEVLGAGEALRLVSVGNHAQGTIFRDGAEHITPELEAWIDRAAAAFSAEVPAGVDLPPGDNGLDFGRFDIRAGSIEQLRRAEGLAVIELNGTAAESTNIYDPDRSVLWAWGVLFRQWAMLYRLGARRRAMGVRAMGPLELRRAWRDFERDRPRMDVADER